MNNKRPLPNNNRLLLTYSGLAMKLLVGLALALFAGLKLDEWLKISMPLLVWLLPLLVIVAMIYRVIKDTSKQDKNV